MQKTVVLNVVGLTPSLLGSSMPFLSDWTGRGNLATIQPVLPAVTCSAQATYLTGKLPNDHGIVANGWYFRDESEVKFWRQSNHLIQSPKLWDMARAIDPTFTCANLFWWYNMYAAVDYAITPRPMYPADGRKIPDIHTYPGEIRSQIQSELGQFPLFQFWGPMTSIRSSQWIANSAKWIEQRYHPTLSLVYLPHLDYGLQRFDHHSQPVQDDLRSIDQICQDLIEFYEARHTQVIVLSEYGITPVDRPIHINRILRENGLLTLREELGRELLDAGASRAFAVSDHQIAHIYVADPTDIPKVQALLTATDGIAEVLDEVGKKVHHLDHPRSGELVAIAQPNAWFTYYYWLDDRRAPDFARTVDIHRKPGYDPVELFLDPALPFPQFKIASTLLNRRLGGRALLDVIPLDAGLVQGSHGHVTKNPAQSPVFITQRSQHLDSSQIAATDVCSLILEHLTSGQTKCKIQN
jgi:predicted AlkP superfamily pyrophosphatase or phosphodiesterase